MKGNIQMIDATPVQLLGDLAGNRLYIKREDLIPYCFGGNKARKGLLFFADIDAGDYDCVVTYGSGSSNHCRVAANLAAARGMHCEIISPQEASAPTFNSRMMALFGAHITVCPVAEVHDTIERTLDALRAAGHRPYFIPGGGHGNIGTRAYVDCYEEIRSWEREQGVRFDYIFHASGTGTTQAGLVCGQLLRGDERRIVGISIARKNPRGRDVVVQSVRDYLRARDFDPGEERLQSAVVFDDAYVGAGYGSAEARQTILDFMTRYGIPLDRTYTAKAFSGMQQYLIQHGISGKHILFLHTGGTPLFFDELSELSSLL